MKQFSPTTFHIPDKRIDQRAQFSHKQYMMANIAYGSTLRH